MIYLDNAATSLKKPEIVIDTVIEAMNDMGNSGRSAHGVSLKTSRIIYNTRQKLSDFFHLGSPKGVVFTANATASLNIAIQGLFQPGDHIITTALEHNSVLRPLYQMQSQGVMLSILPADRQGNLSYEDFQNAIHGKTKAIICTHMSNLTGNVVDIQRVGAICKQNNLIFIVDASQSAGFLDINMQTMNIDVLCFTGHKSLMGPQGIGGICIKEEVVIRPLMSGGSGTDSFSQSHPARMPEALEAGTLNGHGIAGLYAALSYIESIRLSFIRKKELQLMWRFYDGIKNLEGVTIYGDFQNYNHGPVIAMNIQDYDSGKIADILYTKYNIAVRSGIHCAPLMHKALGTVQQGAVRFSMSFFNTEEEIDDAIAAVSQLSSE